MSEEAVKQKEAPIWLWVLGVNAWGTLLAVPAWHLHLWNKGQLWVPFLLPLAIFAISAALLSPLGLLFLFPGAILLPAVFAPRLVGADVYVTSTFLITILSFSAYLVGASAATRGGGVPPRSVEVRAHQDSAIPPRWKRRLRMIFFLALCTVFLPTLLLAFSDGTPSPAMTTEEPLQPFIVNACVLLVGLGIAVSYTVGPVISFMRGENPTLRVERNPVRTFSFWNAIFFGIGAAYLYFYVKG